MILGDLSIDKVCLVLLICHCGIKPITTYVFKIVPLTFDISDNFRSWLLRCNFVFWRLGFTLKVGLTIYIFELVGLIRDGRSFGKHIVILLVNPQGQHLLVEPSVAPCKSPGLSPDFFLFFPRWKLEI